MTNKSALGPLAALAAEQWVSGKLSAPSEEWKYSPSVLWDTPLVPVASDIQWTASETVSVTKVSETSDFSVQFGWEMEELSLVPGSIAVLAAAEDGLLVHGEGHLFITVDASYAPYVPVVIRVPEGRQLSVSLVSKGSAQGHVCLSIHLEQDAQCKVNEVHTNVSPFFSSTCLVTQATRSAFEWVGVDCPTNVTLRAIRVRQTGEAATTRMTGLTLGGGQSKNYIHTNVAHLSPNGESRQLVKSVLTDEAVSEFKGLVFVDQIAQKTDSSQSNQNMVLSDHARALSRPQLSIFADDVKCAHGATMSQLDADQIYYLQSRGINPSQAKAVLMAGFADEVIDQMSNDTIREMARGMAQHFFEKVVR